MSEVMTKRFHPRGAGLEVFKRKDDEVLLAGPAGTGKSRAALEKGHALCLANGACPPRCREEHERRGGLKALIVRKTHASLTATGMVTFKEHVAAEALEMGLVKWYGGSGSEPPQFIYANGSSIKVGGMDNPTKIMSSEYDMIFVQEATELSVTDWEKLKTRLRNGRTSFQQLLADCNPEGPEHWLKLRCDEGKTQMLYSRHIDNPVLFDDAGAPTARGEAYLKVLSELTGVRKLRLLGGVWAAAEGVIYAGWDPAVHLTDRKVLPSEWRRIWSIDFGYVNPFVWQMWAIDPDGRAYLEKEIYQTQMLVEDIWHKKILPLLTMRDGVTWKYAKPDWVRADHDAEDRATFERPSGFRTVPAIKDVSPGIQAMQKRLVLRGDGKPRLYVCRDSLVERDPLLAEASRPIGFAGEVTGYVWKAKPNTTAATQDKPEPDEPLKLNDHSMDAARYLIAQLDLRGAPRVRRL